MKNKILLTGATGFVGGALLKRINDPIILGRSAPAGFIGCFYERQLSRSSDFSDCFSAVEVVIHCAARVHVMNEESSDPLHAFREVNVDATLKLAKQAAAAGVKRFIFLSSIKVNGEGTMAGCKYSGSDKPKPEDPYGVSKCEAEAHLKQLSEETGMELVIIRPTLVYGKGVKGNFLNLLKLSSLAIPLPFGSVHNARSMVYLENLVDLIVTCINHKAASGKIFLAADENDVSLSKLICIIRKSMGRSSLLIPVPIPIFKILGRFTGKMAVVERLIGNLQVDTGFAKKHLNWKPPYSIEQGIKDTVDGFCER
jgi:nucleoside-diphosphate-sugar epimerase